MLAQNQFSIILPYFKNLLWLLLLCSGLRLAFYALNSSTFQAIDNIDISAAFLHGIRFDLATVSICLAPWLIIALPLYISQCHSSFILLTKLYWPLAPLLLITSNVADSLYFPFIGRRSGLEVLTFTADLADQASQLLAQYWLFVLFSAFVAIFFILVSNRFITTSPKNARPWYIRVVIALCLFMFAVISIRSTIESKPLSPSHAFNWPMSSTGHLVLNSTFTLLRQSEGQLKKIDFYTSDKQAKALNQQIHSPWPTPAKQDNIVIIVLESFASEYLTKADGSIGYAPFLHSLSQQSLTFKQAYANGRRSIDALPSILAALPPLMQKPFITSSYLGNNVSGLASLLAYENYQTHFFHAAKNDSMYIDTMSQRFGFKNFTGLNEHPHLDDFDGKWGIFDEPFFQHMAQSLNKLPQPFIAGMFSLSSHNPYTLPSKYKNSFPKGSLAIHASIGYTDMALKKFFDTVKTMPWYEKTLFIITADHTSISDNTAYQTTTGRHRIPLMLFSPTGKLPSKASLKVAQHTDIPSTVLDYLGLSSKYQSQLLPFGNSLLSSNEGEAFFTEATQYVLVNNYATLIASHNLEQLKLISKNKNIDNTQLKQAMLAKLKAKIQIFNNGMLNNNFLPSLKK
ncbi:MAG: sulfatase-like hydrolase/transferase [Oceanospirillaceae bacterium]